MKAAYYREFGYKLAVIDLFEVEEKIFLVTRVNVPREFQRKGIGTDMLNEVISDADKDGVTLKIEPSPYPDSNMSKNELVHYYERFGFKFISYNDFMVREPKRG